MNSAYVFHCLFFLFTLILPVSLPLQCLAFTSFFLSCLSVLSPPSVFKRFSFCRLLLGSYSISHLCFVSFSCFLSSSPSGPDYISDSYQSEFIGSHTWSHTCIDLLLLHQNPCVLFQLSSTSWIPDIKSQRKINLPRCLKHQERV